MATGKPAVDKLEVFAQSECKKRDFRLLGPPGERHGSWEWVFHKKVHDVDHFVLLGLTSLPARDYTYTLEVWAGAERGDRFARQLIKEFDMYDVDPPSELEEILTLAMDFAERLKAGDLTELYLPSRR